MDVPTAAKYEVIAQNIITIFFPAKIIRLLLQLTAIQGKAWGWEETVSLFLIRFY